MAINPFEFLVIAHDIAELENVNEASLRMAIGRSYYAAFLTAESYLTQHHGIQKAPSEEGKPKGIHADVIYTLEQRNERNLKSAGIKLKQARDLRVISDYKPNDDIVIDDLLDAIDYCDSIIKEKLI